jgi:hypothetical protein
VAGAGAGAARAGRRVGRRLAKLAGAPFIKVEGAFSPFFFFFFFFFFSLSLSLGSVRVAATKPKFT